MPYVIDKGYVLSEAQEALRQAVIATAREFSATKDRLPALNHPMEGYLMGTLVIPAHVEDGWVDVPERRHKVYYSPGYGVTTSFVTTNGSAWNLASACEDIARWEPAKE